MVMNKEGVSRRQFMAGTGVVIGSAMTCNRIAAASDANKASFSYCLNTSTIRGQNLSLEKELEITARAGYNA
ncbi:MAG: hypothetical protein PVH77_01360, partial [Phycisphaerales bacterium]